MHPCQQVTEFDVYGMDSTDGAMVNNGTASIGCGLGCAPCCPTHAFVGILLVCAGTYASRFLLSAAAWGACWLLLRVLGSAASASASTVTTNPPS